VGTHRRHAPRSVEWPTLLVAAGVWGGWIAVIAFHDHLPWPIVLVAFAVLGGWYMSLQHEVLHGHPTPWHPVNVALAWAPVSLWLPYRVYRDTHLDHHEVELTVPDIDPESFYVSPERWERAHALRRAALRINRTFLGRLVLGPWLGIPSLIRAQLRLAAHDRSLQITWAVHVLASAVIGWIVFVVAGVPVWQYLVGYVWFGLSVSYVRSFAEHLAVAAPATRSAMVRSNPLMSLLFLNVNLHHAHHALPSVAWYRLGHFADEMGADEIAAAGAGSYRGYWQIACRYAVRPFSQPVHPLADSVRS
jgi:fatty acid desaturase